MSEYFTFIRIMKFAPLVVAKVTRMDADRVHVAGKIIENGSEHITTAH